MSELGKRGQRIITEDFLNKRCFYAGYLKSLRNDWQDVPKPIYTGAIRSMQDCLKYLGLFPSNTESTGAWFGITDSAVQKFCQKYGLVYKAGRTIWPELDSKLKELFI